jgi:iron complex outermembrane receptor protein
MKVLLFFALDRHVGWVKQDWSHEVNRDCASKPVKAWGDWSATALLNFIRGENRSTGDNLYHMMPLNAKLTLVHRLGGWTNTAEMQGVAAKTRISQVRNEVTTPGYALFNLRSSYEWKQARLDFEIENVFDTFYLLPLGGAYLSQGNSMTTGGVPWGMSVPGRGRSFNAALNISF